MISVLVAVAVAVLVAVAVAVLVSTFVTLEVMVLVSVTVACFPLSVTVLLGKCQNCARKWRRKETYVVTWP